MQVVWGDWWIEEIWLWWLLIEYGFKGVLGDIGVYIVDFVMFVVGFNVSDLFCCLIIFYKVENDQIGEYKLDVNDSFNMYVLLENGVIGVIYVF